MEFFLWIVIGILTGIILFLIIKVFLIRKSAREIDAALSQRLLEETDTNTLIDISSRDRFMRRLATNLNIQLRKLRSDRQRFQQGDLELKEAITNISHDLRTPLTAVFGYLDLLKREEKSETVKRYLFQIENRAEMLKQLTEELFRYSVVCSSSNFSVQKVDLRCILEESLVSFYGAMQQKSIIPVIELPTQCVERFLDPTAVSRIFGNIINNALKYSDGDFNVRMEKNGTILFSNTAKQLSIVTVGRLFDRFYTVETGQNSTGLGLSIAKILTEQMEGSYTVNHEYWPIF